MSPVRPISVKSETTQTSQTSQTLPPLENQDYFEANPKPKPVCRVHCHRATIFEVASVLWAKFFKKD